MQNKDYELENKSSRLDEDKKVLLKKIAIWGSIIVISIASLGILVMLAGRGGTPQQPVVNTNLPPITENDIITGNPEAKATLIKYTDFQCPACASQNPILKTLAQENPEELRIVYRHFPLSIHGNGEIAGQAAYSAWKLGKFEEMKDLLYENQNTWGEESDARPIFIVYANDLKLDVDEFEKIMNSEEAKKVVKDSGEQALNLGLNSTPSFFIGNQQIFPRNVDDFRILINAEIEKNN